jgi:hypothetical protein
MFGQALDIALADFDQGVAAAVTGAFAAIVFDFFGVHEMIVRAGKLIFNQASIVPGKPDAYQPM